MTKHSLKQMILNEISNHPRGYLTTLAEVAGFTGKSKGSNFNRVLKDESKEFDCFQGLIKLVEYIWEDETVQMMVQYSTEVDPKKRTARNLLEYLAVYRQFEALNNLLDKMEVCSNTESKEYAKVYRMLYKYEKVYQIVYKDEKDFEREISSLLIEIGELNTTVSELKVFKKMLMNYCYSQLTDYPIVKILSKEIDHEVQLIENNYIKEMYAIRTSQIMSYTNLRVFNNPEVTRKYTDYIIDSNSSTKPFKAHAYFYKGYSYLFTSYEKSVENIIKSITLYEELNRMNDAEYLNELFEFVNVYWDKQYDNNCKYIKNEIYLMIKKGIDVTDYLLNNRDKIDPEIYLFLEGCNTKSNKKWMLSLIKYKNKNDLFLANLAKIELLKNGYDEEILNEMMGDDVN